MDYKVILGVIIFTVIYYKLEKHQEKLAAMEAILKKRELETTNDVESPTSSNTSHSPEFEEEITESEK